LLWHGYCSDVCEMYQIERWVMSRLITTVTAFAATTLMSSAAFAGCNSGTYCTSSGHTSTLPSLSTWSGSNYSSASSYEAAPSYSASSFSSAPSYSYSAMPMQVAMLRSSVFLDLHLAFRVSAQASRFKRHLALLAFITPAAEKFSAVTML